MSHKAASGLVTSGARVVCGIAVAGAISLVLQVTPTAQRGAPAASSASSPAKSVEVVERTILDLQAEMTAGRTTAREIAAAHLARITAYDKQGPAINALIALNPRALEDADALDRERRERGPRGPLHGIPLVIKDNYETADMPTTGGSVALAGFRPGRDAVQVAKLRAAGAVILGKTNLHELAAGIITISSLGGQTRNPYDLARTPGGSSGGTAAAVAASFAMGGMASDTCGSIRIPAANNNLFGLRGTLGLSSRTGIIPLSHTQDIGGPLARTVTDLALLLDATVGDDPADAITAGGRDRRPKSFRDGLSAGALKGTRIGVLKNLFGAAPEDAEVSGIVRKALDEMKAQGAEIVDVTIPGLDEVVDRSSLINLEFKTDLMRYLAQFPNAPVKSLQDILDRGDFHAALEATFKLRNAAVPDPEEIRQVAGPPPGAGRHGQRRVRRASGRGARLSDSPAPPGGGGGDAAGHHLSAERQHRLPGDGDAGRFHHRWCADRFRDAGAGLERRAAVVAGVRLRAGGAPRRAAPTTPPLVNGAVPGAVSFEATATDPGASLRVRFDYDPVSGRLSYEFPPRTVAASLHRGAAGAGSPVLHRLIDPASPSMRGMVILPAYQRTALVDGEMSVLAQTNESRVTLPLRVPR